jgi:hypothetical protein
MIGHPRIVDAPTIPVLYPGEVARAHRIKWAADGSGSVDGWLIEPMPGWRGWWLRWSYRLFWRFVPAGRPKIDVNVTGGDTQADESAGRTST